MDVRILLIDDGELDTVRAMLSDLGLEYEQLAASKLASGSNVPSNARLLVTTARTALQLPARPFEHLGSCWIAVVEGDSKTQRTRLRKLGFDYLIPSQAHPAVVRALLLRSVYRGRERHSAARVALGIAVGWRSGWRRGRALLVDLSIDGCRLMLDTRPERGQTLTLHIPIPGETRPLRVKGDVVRTAPARSEGGPEGQVAVGVHFRPLSNAVQAGLAALLRERAAGPAVSGQPSAPPIARRPATPAYERKRARARYPQDLDAMFTGATRTLLGRDLSEQGVRVEPDERLALRERVRLALHGCPSGEPILVEAHVARDDGPRGLMLQFDSMEPGDRTRLCHLIATLPKVVRSLDDDAALHALELTRESAEHPA